MGKREKLRALYSVLSRSSVDNNVIWANSAFFIALIFQSLNILFFSFRVVAMPINNCLQ